MDFSITFIQLLFWGLYLFSPLLVMLSSIILLLGLIVGRIESWKKFDAIYWAFITALTIGYGDIKPLKKQSRILSIAIGAIGLMLTGIFVAITVEVSARAFSQHIDQSVLQKIESKIQ